MSAFESTLKYHLVSYRSVIVFARLRLIARDAELQIKNRTFEGMSDMSYTIEHIQLRAFYTHIFANLNGTSPLFVSYFAVR